VHARFRGRNQQAAGAASYLERCPRHSGSHRTSRVEANIKNPVHWNDKIAVDELGQLLGACILHVVGRHHIITAHEFRLDKSPGKNIMLAFSIPSRHTIFASGDASL